VRRFDKSIFRYGSSVQRADAASQYKPHFGVVLALPPYHTWVAYLGILTGALHAYIHQNPEVVHTSTDRCLCSQLDIASRSTSFRTIHHHNFPRLRTFSCSSAALHHTNRLSSPDTCFPSFGRPVSSSRTALLREQSGPKKTCPKARCTCLISHTRTGLALDLYSLPSSFCSAYRSSSIS
jgi:hypothetical protein